MARVPVSLTPTNLWDIGGVRYPIDVTATCRVAGDDQARSLGTRAAVEAQVPDTFVEMGAAAAVLPSLCLAAAYARWRRTR